MQKKRRGSESGTSVIQLGPLHFPPLPSSKDKKKSGFTEDYIKYTKEDLVDVINKLNKELNKPENMPAVKVVLEQANTELQVTKQWPRKFESELTAAEIAKRATQISFAQPTENASQIQTTETTNSTVHVHVPDQSTEAK